MNHIFHLPTPTFEAENAAEIAKTLSDADTIRKNRDIHGLQLRFIGATNITTYEIGLDGRIMGTLRVQDDVVFITPGTFVKRWANALNRYVEDVFAAHHGSPITAHMRNTRTKMTDEHKANGQKASTKLFS